MTLEELGYNSSLENYRRRQNLGSYDVGRVIVEHKDKYIVSTGNNEYDAEIIGNLRFSATSKADFPVVGDWVALVVHDENKALIHNIFPRKQSIARQAVGKFGEKQIIGSNIDYTLIMLAVDRDFNINRLERYLSISYSAKIKPIIVLNKLDLIDEIELTAFTYRIRKRIQNVPLVTISNKTKVGYQKLKKFIEMGKTFCLLGSSGVGKSTLINNLLEKAQMKTDTISLSTKKGRHITSHRELIVLESGGILIDNPGMREVGIADTTSGLEDAFDEISKLSSHCRFSDCTHTQEIGCAILTAVEEGNIDKSYYDNYIKMKREKIRFQSSIVEKRKKDKQFGKMVKEFKKFKEQIK
ncbi:MAG: ribosome small subunit-dependent GTPase A [Candidatus Neomarinimicrobiota bacterium]